MESRCQANITLFLWHRLAAAAASPSFCDISSSSSQVTNFVWRQQQVTSSSRHKQEKNWEQPIVACFLYGLYFSMFHVCIFPFVFVYMFYVCMSSFVLYTLLQLYVIVYYLISPSPHHHHSFTHQHYMFSFMISMFFISDICFRTWYMFIIIIYNYHWFIFIHASTSYVFIS